MKKETPKLRGGSRWWENDITEALSYEAWAAGMTLSSWESHDTDPVVLYAKDGHIIKQWPENYIPSMAEIDETIKEVLRGLP